MPGPYCTAVNAFNFSWKTHEIYAFPFFSLVGAAISKLITEPTPLRSWLYPSEQHGTGFQNLRPSAGSPHSAPFRFKNAFPTRQIVKSSPTVYKASTFSSHPIRQSLAQFGLPRKIKEVILAAWKRKTAAIYKPFIDRWKFFCMRGSENCYL